MRDAEDRYAKDPTPSSRIAAKLDVTEAEEQLWVDFAVENGSRGWVCASPDGSHHLRVGNVRPPTGMCRCCRGGARPSGRPITIRTTSAEPEEGIPVFAQAELDGHRIAAEPDRTAIA